MERLIYGFILVVFADVEAILGGPLRSVENTFGSYRYCENANVSNVANRLQTCCRVAVKAVNEV